MDEADRLAEMLRKYHAVHLSPCTAANPSMDCSCGLNDLLAGTSLPTVGRVRRTRPVHALFAALVRECDEAEREYGDARGRDARDAAIARVNAADEALLEAVTAARKRGVRL
jgi:hypothetical protein